MAWQITLQHAVPPPTHLSNKVPNLHARRRRTGWRATRTHMRHHHHQRGRAVTVAPVLHYQTSDTHTSTTSTTLETLEVTTTLTTRATTTVTRRNPTTREQLAALAAGTHPRCGSLSTIMGWCGCDGDCALVVRVLWEWLMDNARFYCVKWVAEKCKIGVMMITFGVSPDLLTLTHETRWWAERKGDVLLAANEEYVVLIRGALFCLQDRVTGQMVRLVERQDVSFSASWKWMVLCDPKSREMIVVEIPKKSKSGPTTIKIPTVVPLDTGKGTWEYCFPEIVVADNGDHVLLLFEDPNIFFEIVVVDLVQTCSSKALAVLSSAVPRSWCLYR
ncbi:hypothetical protein Pelo_6887 [Pelomyxa schiedti]|nr:hypothetical protein Pelo_6887 [Pelomyxa schiedti]